MKTLLRICLPLLLLGSFVQRAPAENAPFLKDIGSGIYIHHGQHLDIDTGYQGDICNISVILGAKGVAVIDTGGSLKIGAQLREAIQQITQLPILYVINTHVHPDHIYGDAAFITDHPQFVGHVKLAHAMQLREDAYNKLNQKLLGQDAKGSTLVLPTLNIDVGKPVNLDLGGRTLLLTAYANAHTNTDISVIDSQTATLFTGDILFTQRTPVVEGDIKGLIATLEIMKSYPAKAVVPGHGLETSDWQAAIDNELRYLKALLKDIRAAIERGDAIEKTMDTAAASEKDNWLLFDIANRRNVNIIYPQLEWE